MSVATVGGVDGQTVDEVAAATGFSGVVRVDRDGKPVVAKAYGLADRRHGIANTVDTRFAVASGTKTLTALTVVSLIESGLLEPTTTARSLLGEDLPLIADDVTVEHLLGHRSGIGDYLDEDQDLDFDDYLMTVSGHELVTTEDYLNVLDGFPSKFAAGTSFSYCNSGYVVLALLAERASGEPYHDLVKARVLEPAAMTATAFLRSDELPGDAALGYLSATGLRTNVFHLPVRGNGDGGVYTTAADVSALWAALFAGRIVSSEWVQRMTQPPPGAAPQPRPYGLGIWLEDGGVVRLEGGDTGVDFGSRHDPATGATRTVIANVSDGAGPMWRGLAALE